MDTMTPKLLQLLDSADTTGRITGRHHWQTLLSAERRGWITEDRDGHTITPAGRAARADTHQDDTPDPARLAAYLADHGWERNGTRNGATVWRKRARRVIVPDEIHYDDDPDQLRQAVAEAAREECRCAERITRQVAPRHAPATETTTDNNTPHILIGAHRVDIRHGGQPHATRPHSRGARWFTRESGQGDGPTGSVHLGTGHPIPAGDGPLIELGGDDPDWWDEVAEAAATTARALRDLTKVTPAAYEPQDR